MIIIVIIKVFLFPYLSVTISLSSGGTANLHLVFLYKK
jgi:hypothetical protein